MRLGGKSGTHDFQRIESCASAFLPELAASQACQSDEPLSYQVDTGDFEESVSENAYVSDSRPGEFDGKRGLTSLPLVYGHREDGETWHVRVTAGGIFLALTAEQARRLGRELLAYADLTDEGNAR